MLLLVQKNCKKLKHHRVHIISDYNQRIFYSHQNINATIDRWVNRRLSSLKTVHPSNCYSNAQSQVFGQKRCFQTCLNYLPSSPNYLITRFVNCHSWWRCCSQIKRLLGTTLQEYTRLKWNVPVYDYIAFWEARFSKTCLRYLPLSYRVLTLKIIISCSPSTFTIWDRVHENFWCYVYKKVELYNISLNSTLPRFGCPLKVKLDSSSQSSMMTRAC